jgi:NTP pyrophosphatase (non-canonical NTP hydrolase)
LQVLEELSRICEKQINMSKIDLNALRDRAYKTACEHGFHDQELSNEHCLCLVISELMEAVEADRKGKRANVDWYNKKIANSRICQGLDPDIPKERGYEVAYNETIKGSIEEELADAVIRLLDLAGLRNLNLNRFALVNVVSKKKTFTENIYSIVKDITNYKYTLEELVNYAITQVFVLSDILDIDLLWHIEQKMKYNELREKMHGKKY